MNIKRITVIAVLAASAAACTALAVSASGPEASSGSQLQDRSRDQAVTQEQLQTQTRDQDRIRLRLETCEASAACDPCCDVLRVRERISLSDQFRTLLQQCEQDCLSPSFTDIGGHWAERRIQAVHAYGFVNGYPDGRFAPEDPLSEAEGRLMIARLLGALDGTCSKNGSGEACAVALNLAAQSRFAGESPMNRLQFAVMLANGLGIQPSPAGLADAPPFSDLAEVSPADAGSLSVLKDLGVLSGDADRFSPERPVSRGEAASILDRFIRLILDAE